MSVTIQFEIPVAISGRLPRSRQPKIIIAFLTVPVDVMNIDAHDAPVAATLSGSNIRVFDGEFFESVGDVPQLGGLRRISSDSTPALHELTCYHKVHSELMSAIGIGRDVRLEHPAGIHDLSAYNIREMDETCIQRQLDAFAKRSDRVIVVDGLLYAKIRQPRLSVFRELYGSAYARVNVHLIPDGERLLRHILTSFRICAGVYSLANYEMAFERSRDLANAAAIAPDKANKAWLTVHRPDLFDDDTLAVNAAIFATGFLDNFFYRRMAQEKREVLADLLKLGADTLHLVLQLDGSLKAYVNDGSSASLIDTAAELIERPDDDPIWNGYPADLIEQRDFVRACLDREPIGLKLHATE